MSPSRRKRSLVLAGVAVGSASCVLWAALGPASSRVGAGTVRFIPNVAFVHATDGPMLEVHLMNDWSKPIHGEIVRTEIETNDGWQVASNFPSLPPGVYSYPPMFRVDKSKSALVSVAVPAGTGPWRAIFRYQRDPASSEVEAAVRLVSRKLAAKLNPRPWITNTSERITR